MESANRYIILDPDVFPQNQHPNKLKKKSLPTEFCDNDENTLIIVESSVIDDDKWKRSDIDNEKKYKNFNTFVHFGTHKKSKQNNSDPMIKRKRMLCSNIVTTGTCCHGDKCKFSHNLSEQKVDPVRKHVYEILLSDSDLSHIDFQKNVGLYRSLKDLTKMCDKQYCTGGYNCNFGICGTNSKHICSRDLDYGDCDDPKCNSIHLTKRNLKPFYSGYLKKEIPTQSLFTLLSNDKNKEVDELSEISSVSESSNELDECEQSIFD